MQQNRASLIIITEPASEPVTTEDVKAYLNITHSSDDTVIGTLIRAAREAAESYTGRAFITQVWDYLLDDNSDPIQIPRPPLQGATPYYTGMDDTESAEASSKYEVITKRTPGEIMLKQGQTWESTRGVNGFRVRFVAGYGDSASDVPQGIKEGIKALAGFLYEHRGDSSLGDKLDAGDVGGIVKLCPVAAICLRPYKVGGAWLG